jgi:hypothetical protein
VIETNAIAGRTTRTSASNIKTVDVGSASLAKSLEGPDNETCSVRRRGFFVGHATHDGIGADIAADATESGPARLARWRLIAGPIPVVFFETGRYRSTH